MTRVSSTAKRFLKSSGPPFLTQVLIEPAIAAERGNAPIRIENYSRTPFTTPTNSTAVFVLQEELLENIGR
ncbi:hypothetical protein Trydic_g13166 [Trypoxylus dichotomus]